MIHVIETFSLNDDRRVDDYDGGDGNRRKEGEGETRVDGSGTPRGWNEQIVHDYVFFRYFWS